MAGIDTSHLICCAGALIHQIPRPVGFSIRQQTIVNAFSGGGGGSNGCSYRYHVYATFIICIFDLLRSKANDHVDDGIEKLGHCFANIINGRISKGSK